MHTALHTCHTSVHKYECTLLMWHIVEIADESCVQLHGNASACEVIFSCDTDIW